MVCRKILEALYRVLQKRLVQCIERFAPSKLPDHQSTQLLPEIFEIVFSVKVGKHSDGFFLLHGELPSPTRCDDQPVLNAFSNDPVGRLPPIGSNNDRIVGNCSNNRVAERLYLRQFQIH